MRVARCGYAECRYVADGLKDINDIGSMPVYPRSATITNEKTSPNSSVLIPCTGDSFLRISCCLVLSHDICTYNAGKLNYLHRTVRRYIHFSVTFKCNLS